MWTAVLILIGLVITLIIISVGRDNTNYQRVHDALEQIKQLKQSLPKVINGKDGHTPVLGVDYFNGKDAPVYAAPKDGKDSVSLIKEVPVNGLSAYELAIKGGFKGTLNQWLDSLKVPGEKGDPGPAITTTCQNGYLAQKIIGDSFFKPILVDSKHIKCELSDD